MLLASTGTKAVQPKPDKPICPQTSFHIHTTYSRIFLLYTQIHVHAHGYPYLNLSCICPSGWRRPGHRWGWNTRTANSPPSRIRCTASLCTRRASRTVLQFPWRWRPQVLWNSDTVLTSRVSLVSHQNNNSNHVNKDNNKITYLPRATTGASSDSGSKPNNLS